jgi:hypothetical protein
MRLLGGAFRGMVIQDPKKSDRLVLAYDNGTHKEYWIRRDGRLVEKK